MSKKFLVIISILTLINMAFTLPDEKLIVDASKSQVKWTGYHLAKSYEHWGYVTIKSGSITTDGSKITSGEFILDMNTIVDKDLEKEEDNAKLVGHLKSEDFFAVGKFPEAKLVIKKTDLQSGNTYKTTADLTIRGITKEISFETVVKTLNENSIEASADFRIKRTDFEVMYGWSLENAMLDGEFRIEVQLVANK